jgi:hypothetical protein
MKGKKCFLLSFLLVLMLALSGCGGGGGGSSSGGSSGGSDGTGDGGGGDETTISGSVSLSSLAGKPQLEKISAELERSYKTGTLIYSSDLLKVAGIQTQALLDFATVELFDADHPEWLYPVSVVLTDGDGADTFSTRNANASKNLNSDGSQAYNTGDPIPAGNYTVIASKSGAGTYGKPLVAVQAVVKTCSGAVTGNDLTAVESDTVPAVKSISKLAKNSDGSFGSTTTTLPLNAAISVNFTSAMARLSVINNISVSSTSGAVTGNWKISADLLSTTFIPDADLTADTVYTVTVKGGKYGAVNVYGVSMAADVKGYFKTAAADNLAPTAVKESPTGSTNVPITSAIRIAANDAMDILSISVSTSPSIGDKPFIQYIGPIGTQGGGEYKYVYEIIPSIPLKLNTVYNVTVSGGKDLAGNSMNTLSFSFQTEASTDGVDSGANTTVQTAQADVKDVLGKWVRAMNDGDVTLLASYMSGDFVWVEDEMGGGMDKNLDGRASLQEFTSFMEMWFGMLADCGITMSAAVVDVAEDGTITSPGNINIGAGYAMADFAFLLTGTTSGATSTNPSCSDMMPDEVLYLALKKINGAWFISGGGNKPIMGSPPALKPIELGVPVDGKQFPDPTGGLPLTPEFTWTGVANVSSYALVVIDTKSDWSEDGWVAFVPGAGTDGQTVKMKFTPKPGWVGDNFVAPLESRNGGETPVGKAFGFWRGIEDIVPGGSYHWAIVGFDTSTVSDFSAGKVLDPVSDLLASSLGRDFRVAGVYPELKVTVTDVTGAITYEPIFEKYDVGSANNVKLNITTLDAAGSQGYTSVMVRGYGTNIYNSTDFDASGKAFSTVSLFEGSNEVWLCDNFDPMSWNCDGLEKGLMIFTAGGTPPVIEVTSVVDQLSNELIGDMSLWRDIKNPTVTTIDVGGTVSDALLYGTDLNLNVHSENGMSRATATVSGTGTFAFAGVPVYNGWNSVEIRDSNDLNQYRFHIETQAGSTYTSPITVAVDYTGGGGAVTPIYSGIWGSGYDAGSATQVDITITELYPSDPACAPAPGTYCSLWSQNDSDWNWITGGQIIASSTTMTVDLFKGMNILNIGDDQNNWINVEIFTAGGAAFLVPNEVINVYQGNTDPDKTTPITPVDTGGGPVYDIGTDCNVIIVGNTVTYGDINMDLNYEKTDQTVYFNEHTTYDKTTYLTGPDGNGLYTYEITKSVYSDGLNHLAMYDGNYDWAGINVTSTGACTPVVFDVGDVTDGVTSLPINAYGDYDAGTLSTVTITGTAKQGKTVTAYVYGQYSTSVSTTAGAGDTFSIDVPVYNGFNGIDLTDGSSWQYIGIVTTGGSTYTSPFTDVMVSEAGTQAPAVMTWSDVSSSDWDAGPFPAIDILGTVTSGDGIGQFYANTAGISGPFTITDGMFGISAIPVYDGWNYFDLYDTQGNHYYMNILSTNGNSAPIIVMITNPGNYTTVSGTVTVTADVDGTFNMMVAHAWVSDDYLSMWTSYSSDPFDQANYGDMPITLGDGTISLDANVVAGNPTTIGVEACDDQWICHGHEIYVNNATPQAEYFWKPGVESDRDKLKARAIKRRQAIERNSRK